MGNFYGGREGRSFVITKEFQTITEMVEKFSMGPSYNEVHFDEYVLINTINKNSPENGQIFRRGYDFDSDRTINSYKLGRDEKGNTYLKVDIPAGGAVYVGTIVGPAGRAPIFNFNLYDNVVDLTDIAILDDEKITTAFETTTDMLTYLTAQFGTGEVPYNAEKKVVLSGDGTDIVGYSHYVKIVKSDGANTFNYYFYYDNLLYVDSPEASIGWYLLDTPPVTGKDSYTIPNQHMIPGVTYQKNEDGSLYYKNEGDGRLHLVPESYHDTIDWTYCSIRNENNEDSTAYVGFKFGYNIFEIESETTDAYYNRSDELGGSEVKTNKFNNLNLIKKEDTSTDGVEHPFYHKWTLKIPKGIKGESIENVKVITASADVVAFDVDIDGNLQYNSVSGEILVKDYDGKQDDIDNARKIIVYDYYCYDRVPEGEHHLIYLGDFNKIDDFTLAHNGQITMQFSHDDDYVTSSEDWLHWIDKLVFEEDGTVTVTFNDSSWNVSQAENQDVIVNGVLTKDQLITWMTEFSLDAETGQLIVNFNNNRLIANINKTLQWVKEISISDDGTVTTDYTNIANKVENQKLNWIKSCTFDSDTGALEIIFNNSNLANINKTFNYVKAVERDVDLNSETFNHLLLLHSDPNKQGDITFNGTNGWQDLGGLSYMMVAKETEADLTAKQNALSVGGVWFITKEV